MGSSGKRRVHGGFRMWYSRFVDGTDTHGRWFESRTVGQTTDEFTVQFPCLYVVVRRVSHVHVHVCSAWGLGGNSGRAGSKSEKRIKVLLCRVRLVCYSNC